MGHEEVLQFWFEDIERKMWFKKDLEFDTVLRERFGALHTNAAACELYSWRETARGRVAAGEHGADCECSGHQQTCGRPDQWQQDHYAPQ